MLLRRQQYLSLRSYLQHFHLNCLAILLLVALFAIPSSVLAQSNGITVGQPKVYDNQSLMIMLDQLRARLDQVQAIDQQSLTKALGLFQGSQQQDVSRSFDVSVSLTPKALTDASSNNSTGGSSPGGASSSSNPGSNSAQGSSSKNSSTSGNSSSGSALPELLAAPAYKPDYGENAIDLLSDQVDLTYQVFNLRMLLERSVTDRLKDGSPRRQAVVSFNISLDPPANAHDAAAYVEITLSTQKGPVALVASMPQEKTYNATSLSSSSNAFGGSAVAKIITVGYNQRKRSQTFFLYRDSDTLALERAPVGNAVTFGWVFRPVLGRRSVSPGMRQMFAVISLPETDLVGDEKRERPAYPHVQVHVKTYWLHYDKNTSTTATHPGFWSARNLPAPEGFQLSDIEALPTESIETALNPRIRNVELFQTTNGNTVLQIAGENFFTGTTITIGDKTFAGPQDGLFLKSSQTMLLTANTDILSRAWKAVVNGRYGPAVALYPSASPNGIIIAKSKLAPKGPNFTELELIIGDADTTKDLTLDNVKDLPDPVLSLNGTQIPYRSTWGNTVDTFFGGARHHYIIATVTVPNSLLHSRDNRAGVIFPLLGETWAAEDLIYDNDEVQVTKMTSGSTTTLLISRPGIAFSKNWSLILDNTYALIDPAPLPAKPSAGKKSKTKQAVPPPQFSSVLPCQDPKVENDPRRCYMLRIVADTKFLSNYQNFILVSEDGHAQVLDVPAATPQKEAPSAPPKITAISPSTVGLNEVVTVTITGSGLDAIKQVSFQGKALTFWAVPDKEKSTDSAPVTSPDATPAKTSQIQVLLTRDVTSKEGHQELLLQVDSKNMVTIVLTVASASTAAKNPASNKKKTP